MTAARYPTVRDRAAVATDVLLVAVAAFALVLGLRGPLGWALIVGGPATLAVGAWTLHFPRRVAVDDAGVAFFGYGRAHRYAWSSVERVLVRRFLVGDRVLVRVRPAPPFAGRYWLLDAMEGYPEVVAALEARAALTSKTRPAPAAAGAPRAPG